MSSKGRRFSGEQKAKIALEALRGDRTLQEVASKHQVHPNQVWAWKRQAVEGLGEVFSNGVERHRRAHESELRELSVGRSSLYYTPKGKSAETLARMRPIDERFVKSPFYGARQMVRLMRLLGLQALYRAPRTSDPHPEGAEQRPRKHRQAQVDGGCIESVDGVVELQPQVLVAIQRASDATHGLRELGVDAPIPALIRIGQVLRAIPPRMPMW